MRRNETLFLERERGFLFNSLENATAQLKQIDIVRCEHEDKFVFTRMQLSADGTFILVCDLFVRISYICNRWG